MQEKDVVVIGGGPAGYIAAIRASQLGARVTLVEKEKLGGACLHRACVPTKFLLKTVERYHAIKNAEQYGVSINGVNIDLSKVQTRKNAVISQLLDGIKNLMTMNTIEVISGKAKLKPLKQIEIDSGQEPKITIQARKIILTTGSHPKVLPIPGADAPDIFNPEQILNMEQVPDSLIFIGGGVVGIEMATILAGLGCKVSVVEIMPHILPGEDAELVKILERALKRDGVKIYTGTRVTHIEGAEDNKQVSIASDHSESKLEARAVAIAVGYRPYLEGLGLAQTGIATINSGIQTNQHMETSVPDIYAAGDVTGGMMLAYVAMAEGIAAAENAMGIEAKIDYQAVPRCIFSSPEIASVGLTEDEALAQGHQIQCGRFPFSANSAAAIMGESRGMVKIITEQDSGQVLGIHIIGPEAVNLIGEATLAMKMGATAKDIQATIHAHPTLSEAFWEASLDITGEALNFFSHKK